MKRFWKDVTVAVGENGWLIKLDDRPLRTPARAPLLLPTTALAQAVAAEWQDAAEQVDPRSMPLTGLSNAAIDRVAPDKDAFALGLSHYAASDLLCYRAEGPPTLVAQQSALWDPLLDWAHSFFAAEFVITHGIIPVDQPPQTIALLAQATAELDAFRLAAMSPLVTVGGSLVAALALLRQEIDVDQGWAAVSLDERWQLERWGSDVEAEKTLALREGDFRAGHQLLSLLA